MASLICDKEGVPELIQALRYCPGDMSFEVSFFNGRTFRCYSEWVCPSIELMTMVPSKIQYLEAENTITNYALENWAEINEAL